MEAVSNDDLGDEDFCPLSNAFAKKIKNIDGPMIRSTVLISPWSKSVKFREKADVETCEAPVDSDGAEFGNKVTDVNVSRAANGLLNSFASIVNDAPNKKKVNFCALTTNESVNHADLAIPLESVEEVNNRFANTLYGYFIGKKLAFPLVEKYVKNTWAKYGIQRVMLKHDFFFFQFSTRKGMEQVLENGPWTIRTLPIILNTWEPSTILKKDEITKAPVWVKLHNIPFAAYTEVGLSLIATKIGKPIMLDAYTSDMCLTSWGQTGFARALIEVSSTMVLRDSLVVAIPFLKNSGHSLETIEIEYEWQPPRCSVCKVFGHTDDHCPKNGHVNTCCPKSTKEHHEAAPGPTSSLEEHDDGFKVVKNRKANPKGTKMTSGINMGKGPRFAPRKQVYVAKAKTQEAASVNATGVPVHTSNSFGTLEVEDDTGIPSSAGDSINDKAKTGKSSGTTKDAGIDSSRGKDSRVDIGATSKPSETVTYSATKVSNPFSKVGNVTCSDSEEDEVLEPDNPMASFLASGGGGGFDLEDFDDYAEQVYDLPRHLEDMCDMYDVSLSGHGRK